MWDWIIRNEIWGSRDMDDMLEMDDMFEQVGYVNIPELRTNITQAIISLKADAPCTWDYPDSDYCGCQKFDGENESAGSGLRPTRYQPGLTIKELMTEGPYQRDADYFSGSLNLYDGVGYDVNRSASSIDPLLDIGNINPAFHIGPA